MFKKLFVISILFFLVASSVQAAANRFIPFQARLTDGDGIVLNGVYKLIFIIYDEPTGGTAKWSEEHQDVSVLNGMVNVILGTKTNLDDPKGNGTKPPVYFTENRYLGITVDTNSNQEMVPRHQIVPSFQSKIADRAFLADRATDADNADRLNNQLPAFYATKTSVDDVSSDIASKLSQTDNRITSNSAAIQALVPPGTIMYFATNTPPPGWLKANGATLVASEYTDLFNAIGYTFGGSGAVFNLPDLRGVFVRGWSDDRPGEFDSGRVFGSYQADSNKSHSHHDSYSDHSAPTAGGPHPAYSVHTTNMITISTSNEGEAESKPKNLALLACIKM